MRGLLGGYTAALVAALLLELVKAEELDRESEHSRVADLERELSKRKFYLILVHALLALACAFIAHLIKTIFNNNKVHRQLVNEHGRLQQEYHHVTCGLQDEIGDLKCVHSKKRDLERVLKQSRGDVLVLRAHLEKSESDRSGLADLVKVYAEEAAKMKSQLSDAQAWQKECVQMDNELNDLHKLNEDKGKTIQAQEKKLAEMERVEAEYEYLRAYVDEVWSKSNKQAEELDAMKNVKKEAEEWKKRSNRHSEDKLKLIACARDEKKRWEKYQQKAKLWKERAHVFEKEKEDLKAALEHGSKEYEKLGAWSVNASKEGAKLSKKLKAKDGEVEKVKATLATAEKELEQVKGTLEITIMDKAKVQQVVKQNAKQIEDLKVALDGSQENTRKLEEDIGQKIAQVEEGQKITAELQSRIQTEIEKGAEVERALEVSQGKTADLQKVLDGRVEEAHRLKGKLLEAGEEIQGLREEAKEKSDAIARLEEMARRKEEEEIEKENQKKSEAQDVCVQTDVVEMHDKTTEVEIQENCEDVKDEEVVVPSTAADENVQDKSEFEISDSEIEKEIEKVIEKIIEEESEKVIEKESEEESEKEIEKDGAESTTSTKEITEANVDSESAVEGIEENVAGTEAPEGSLTFAVAEEEIHTGINSDKENEV